MEAIKKIGIKIKESSKKIIIWLKNLPKNTVIWFKKTVMSIILYDKKNEAKWKNKRTGLTQYVVAINWHDVRVLNKQEYDYCKKWLLKKRGKDIRQNLMYRADHTLIKSKLH